MNVEGWLLGRVFKPTDSAAALNVSRRSLNVGSNQLLSVSPRFIDHAQIKKEFTILVDIVSPRLLHFAEISSDLRVCILLGNLAKCILGSRGRGSRGARSLAAPAAQMCPL